MKNFYVALYEHPGTSQLLAVLESEPGQHAVRRPHDMKSPGPVILIRCTAVQSTDYGFLRLVPYQEETDRSPLDAIAIDASHVAWIGETDSPTKIGFR